MTESTDADGPIWRIKNGPDGEWPRRVLINDHSCRITYTDANGATLDRTITIHLIRQGMSDVMLDATCHQNGPGRTFRLSRISAITPLDGTQLSGPDYLKRDLGVTVAPSDDAKSGKITAPRINVEQFSATITGELAAMSRSDAASRIEAVGGRVTGNIDTTTTHLIVGSGPSVSDRKLKQAQSRGIAIMDESQLTDFLNGRG